MKEHKDNAEGGLILKSFFLLHDFVPFIAIHSHKDLFQDRAGFNHSPRYIESDFAMSFMPSLLLTVSIETDGGALRRILVPIRALNESDCR